MVKTSLQKEKTSRKIENTLLPMLNQESIHTETLLETESLLEEILKETLKEIEDTMVVGRREESSLIEEKKASGAILAEVTTS